METQTDVEALDLLIRGFQVSRMLGLVADLAVADKLPEHDVRTVEQLAGACDVQPQPLLRALAAFGVFCVTADGAVSHSARQPSVTAGVRID